MDTKHLPLDRFYAEQQETERLDESLWLPCDVKFM